MVPSGGGFVRAGIALAIAGMIGACGAAGDKKGDDASTDSGAAHQDGGSSEGGASDAALDGMTGGDGAMRTDGRVADAGIPSVTPVLDSAQLRETGRFGYDVRIDVVGSDSDGDTVAVRLELTDDQGMTIAIGGKSPADVSLNAALPAQAHSSGYAVIPKLFHDHNTLKHAKVSLVDSVGNISNTVEVDLQTQPVIAADGVCDTTYVMNRCDINYGCKGTLPATCMVGQAPTITRAGYYSDELGPRVLIEGSDPDDDANGYKIEFFDAAGQPFSYDDDNDPMTPSVSSFSQQVDVSATGGTFFFRFDPTSFFVDMVPKVRLTVTDLGGNSSTPVDKQLNDGSSGAPQVNMGAQCDSRGFNRCPMNDVCALANKTATNTTCITVTAARSNACANALVLDPFKGITSVMGNIKGPSLWDSPDGCSTANPTGQPEAVVKLILSQPASKVVLSSDHPFTAFDTTLYAIAGCTGMPTAAWCADDQPAPAVNTTLAVLELDNLPARTDYFVIVDSFTSGSGTTFQLDVTVTQ